MNETAAAFRDLFRWLLQSWWRAAITGFILAAGATGFAALVIQMLDGSGMGDHTFLMGIAVYLPANFVLSIGGFNQTEAFRALMSRFWPPAIGIVLNGIVMAMLFAILVLLSRAFQNKENS